MMRRAVVIIVIAAGVIACHKTPPPHPPQPPAAPATPPPAPPPTPQATPVPDEYSRVRALDLDEINRLGLFADVHFDFDRSDIRHDDGAILARDADALRKYEFLTVTVEGHCDERGTVKYNLALGERRARAAMDYLASLGIAPDRLRTVSYGKESPLCTEHAEGCWWRNRRVHLSVTGKGPGRP